MHTDAKYLKKIPLSVKDKDGFSSIVDIVCKLEKAKYMSDNWFDLLEMLNSYVYKAYDITKNEADFIDCEMKQIQSKRWLKNG